MKILTLLAAFLLLLSACSGEADSSGQEIQADPATTGQYYPTDNAVAADRQYSAQRGQWQTQPNQPQRQQQPGQYRGQQPGGANPAGAQPMQADLPGNTVRMQRVEILDRNGFDRPMAAAYAMIPVGWQTQGGVIWTPNNTCGNGYNFNWSATSPDGSRGIAIFPGEQWNWSNFPVSGMRCPTAQISSVKQYLETMIMRARPGARIIDYRAREDLTKLYQQLNSVTPMPGGELRTWVEAGEVLVGYTNQNGVEVRETAAAVASFNLNRMQGIYGDVMETLSAQTLAGFAAFAPNGQLNFQANETMRKALQAAPEWQSRINAHNNNIAQSNIDSSRKISRINADGARQRSEIIAKTGQEISDMQMEGWRKSSESFDIMARENGEMINEVETYNDPNSVTGEVQLSYDYKNAWRLNDGTYVMTDDPYFDPYKTTGQNGEQLEVKQ